MVIHSPGPTTHFTLTSTPASASTMSAYDLDVKNAITLFQTTITFPSNAEACANDRFIGLVCLLSFLSSIFVLVFLVVCIPSVVAHDIDWFNQCLAIWIIT